MPKFIIVTGGVLSGLGKGIVTSSIGLLLKSRGFSITVIKIDPYLNCDAGTMNPFQHGEVFVLDDGGEVDLDLGNYERFLDINLSRDNNITTGKAYHNVIEKERRGDYLGKTVQIVPHVTDEIKNWIRTVAVERNADICIVEVGGTVGDIESMPFLEAVRQLLIDEGENNVCFVHTTLVPVLSVVGEQKTKPTQHSVKELRAIGILPDVIVARSPEVLNEDTKRKISLFCNVSANAVFSSPDVSCIYEVPLILERQGITHYLLEQLHFQYTEAHLDDWEAFVRKATNGTKQVTIAMVGKYTALGDSYMSILEAFRHAAAELDAKVNVTWIEAEDFKKKKNLAKIDGFLIPGGFGGRGAEGKIQAIHYARMHNIPFLGICFGFQLAVVEYGRHVLGLSCNSTEIELSTEHPIITILPEQKDVENLGGTMRLGSGQINIMKGTLAYELYNKDIISERHRHRYEVNPDYIHLLQEKGLVFSGVAEDKTRMEILELPTLNYFVASQFHPEFKSHPLKPAPLFFGFIRAAIQHRYGATG